MKPTQPEKKQANGPLTHCTLMHQAASLGLGWNPFNRPVGPLVRQHARAPGRSSAWAEIFDSRLDRQWFSPTWPAPWPKQQQLLAPIIRLCVIPNRTKPRWSPLRWTLAPPSSSPILFSLRRAKPSELVSDCHMASKPEATSSSRR
jgi:hypothetical protein